MLDDPTARDLIAAALGKTIDRAVREHIGGITQEAPLTARIGQMLEIELNGKDILGNHIRIITQDIPDRGRGALEKDIGADLYVGVEVSGPGRRRKTKGFLVQAKLRDKLSGTSDEKLLRDSCKRLSGITEASYVFIYGPSGVGVINATKLVEDSRTRPRDMKTRRVTTLLKKTLECSEGDVDLGLPNNRRAGRTRRALSDRLKGLKVERAVEVIIESSL
ncbi:hypothetical protein [Hoeflea alexandrii]